jgi:hypothetical protein
MGGRYNWVSPGAAAGSAIEDILLQRKAEERQRMLDEITRQNADLNRQQTEASIASHKKAEERATLEAILPTLERDEPITNHPQRDLLERYGYASKIPVPKVDTTATFASPDGMGDFVTQSEGINLPGAYKADNTVDEVSQPEPQLGFKGTEKQRERDRKIKRANELATELKAAKTPEERAAILFKADSEEIDMSGPAWSNLTRESRPTYIMDDATGELKQAANIPDNANIIRRPRAPIGPQGPAPRLFKSTDGKQRRWFRPGENIPDGWAPDTGAGGNQQRVVPPALRNNLTNARKLMEKREPGGAGAFYQAQQNIISDFEQRGLASSDVAEAVRDVLRDLNDPKYQDGWFQSGEEPPTYDEIVEGHQGLFSTPEELEQFKDLLANIL